MDWKHILDTWVLVIGAITVALIVFLAKKTLDWLKTSRETVIIKVPELVLSSATKFGLLHVRDGKDEVSDKGPILHKEHYFKKIDRRGHLKVSIRYTRNLGFQFKCFADYTGITFEELKETLEQDGYLDVRRGAGRPMRAWFICPDYSPCTTVDGIKNNFFYQS